MSNSLIKRVYELELTCTYERHVLQRLADRTNDKTGVCWPSTARIAREVCCSTRKVQGVIKELARRGLVSVEWNAGPKGCNRYCLTLPPEQDAPPHDVHPSTQNAQSQQVRAPSPAPDAPETKKNQKKTLCRNPESQVRYLQVAAIKDGKRYLLGGVSAHKARTLVSEGLVTEEQCKAVGLL